MSAREAIINEIKLAPEALVQEAYDYILFLKSRRSHEHDAAGAGLSAKPDFFGPTADIVWWSRAARFAGDHG